MLQPYTLGIHYIVHALYYKSSVSSHQATYVDKTGDTMSGNLVLECAESPLLKLKKTNDTSYSQVQHTIGSSGGAALVTSYITTDGENAIGLHINKGATSEAMAYKSLKLNCTIWNESSIPISGSATIINDKNVSSYVTPSSIGAAPAYTYSTTDLTEGVSTLAEGKLYFVYE